MTICFFVSSHIFFLSNKMSLMLTKIVSTSFSQQSHTIHDQFVAQSKGFMSERQSQSVSQKTGQKNTQLHNFLHWFWWNRIIFYGDNVFWFSHQWPLAGLPNPSEWMAIQGSALCSQISKIFLFFFFSFLFLKLDRVFPHLKDILKIRSCVPTFPFNLSPSSHSSFFFFYSKWMNE